MADEVPGATPSSAAVSSSPAAAPPAPGSEGAPVPTVSPPDGGAPSTTQEAATSAVTPETEAKPAVAKSFLGDAVSKTPEVAGEAKEAVAETPPAETSLASPPVSYEPFTLPEGQTLDEAQLGAFKDLLGEHKAPQALGQSLVDLYFGEVNRIKTYQQEVWDRTQEQWMDQVRSDPELGGSRLETVAKTCGSVIERFGSNDLRDALTATGMGNHPAMVRFINKIGQFLGEGRPVPAAKPAPAPPPSKAQRRYGGTSLNGSTPS